jgi:hypothetical protein
MPVILKRWMFIILAALLLASCSSTYVYNRLDWLIPWYVNSYVDLSREQRQSLQEQILPLLQWHRQEELVRYQQLQDQAERELAYPINAGQVQNWIAEIILATTRIEESMLEPALEFGTGISDQQMKEFINSLHEKQDEYEDEFLSRSDQEYIEENAENLQELMQRLLGSLNKKQKQRLQQGAQAMQRFDAIWLESRRQWLDELTILLQRDQGWQEKVRQAYRVRELNRPPQYRQIVAHNIAVIADALADVLNSRTDKQRKHATREFQNMRETLGDLGSE